MKPVASVSLDLDNKWSYMKTHGDPGWENFPSYLDIVVPRVLSFLRQRDLTISFFIVGQDAALEKNRHAISSIGSAGHEIANHSYNHEPWLHLYSKEQIVEEFEKTEDALLSVTGERPVGFRGPGFSLSDTVIDVLAERGYEYDCSALPTYIAPFARLFYFLRSPGMPREERQKLKKLFGKFSDGFRSLRPHALKNTGLIEIPVTTLPLLKTPIHATYLMYLASFSPAIARQYWRLAIHACRLAGVQPSLLLHPLDFLSGDEIPELKFFPGMNISSAAKTDLLGFVIDLMQKHFDVGTTGRHARSAGALISKTRSGLELENA